MAQPPPETQEPCESHQNSRIPSGVDYIKAGVARVSIPSRCHPSKRQFLAFRLLRRQGSCCTLVGHTLFHPNFGHSGLIVGGAGLEPTG